MKKRVKVVKEYFLLNMNMVIRFMILSDVVWNGAAALLGPIFALFVVDFIQGGNAAVAGVAAAVYLVTKSVAQIPAATLIDKIRGEKDDFAVMVTGSIIGSLVPLLYLFIDTPLELYGVQFIYGLVIAFTFPSYMAIFTRHIDKNKEGRAWGIYFTMNDLSQAMTASIGGVIATMIGFRPLIMIVSAVGFIGALLLLPIKSKMRSPKRKRRRKPVAKKAARKSKTK